MENQRLQWKLGPFGSKWSQQQSQSCGPLLFAIICHSLAGTLTMVRTISNNVYFMLCSLNQSKAKWPASGNVGNSSTLMPQIWVAMKYVLPHQACWTLVPGWTTFLPAKHTLTCWQPDDSGLSCSNLPMTEPSQALFLPELQWLLLTWSLKAEVLVPLCPVFSWSWFFFLRQNIFPPTSFKLILTHLEVKRKAKGSSQWHVKGPE